VNRIRCDDMRPHIYKTNDGGKTWKEIVDGLPNDPINVVKEDPVRKGLLFAGSERAVYVSFDDGENWQSLRLNMPATSIRDLVIKDDDLVIGTHGRSFWILDDITPLRQLDEKLSASPVILYKPQAAYRVIWNMNTDTPLPQEEPSGENPPDGAMINYFLNEEAKDIKLEIYESTATAKPGKLIRTYTNKDTLYKIPDVNIPHYWIRPQQILSGTEGSHRFLWDMHYAPLNLPASYPIAATYMNTAPDATSPWVMPGKYIAKLTVDGKELFQTLEVKMDPRVKTPTASLKLQHDLSVQCYEGRKDCMKILEELRLYRAMLRGQMTNPPAKVADELNKKDKAARELESTPQGGNEPSFGRLNAGFASVLSVLLDSDMPPTTQMINAVKELQQQISLLKKKWEELRK